MDASTDSAAGRSAPPRTLESKINWLIARLDHLRDAVDTKDKRGSDSRFLISEDPAVLSVLGDQGVGKSTTLRYVCDRIGADPNRLTLPVVSPERFADGDTLFGWVLAALTDLIREKFPELSEQATPMRDGDLVIWELADLLRRQEALARSTPHELFTAFSASPDELAEGVAAVTTAGLRLVTGWVCLLNCLSSEVSQVVIPVDDADQVPNRLGSVLRDLRWLTIHPLVAVVVCANREVLIQALSGDPAFDFMDTKARKQHASGVLVKALPRHLRLELPPLPPADRPAFVPPGETDSLIETLRRFPFTDPKPVGLETLADFFELNLGEREATSPYAEILPDLPRSLDHMWRELQDIAEDSSIPGQRERTANAARCLIERALEFTSERSDSLPEETIKFHNIDPHGLSVEFDFSGLTTGSTIGTGRTLYQTDRHRVSIRRIDAFPIAVQTPDNTNKQPDDLPARFANAHYFAFELADPATIENPPLFLWGFHERPTLPTGSNWIGSLDVDWGRESTDDLFVPVPAWESRFDCYLYAAAWNMTNTLISDLECQPSPRLLEWVLLRHARLVTEVQRSRSIDPGYLRTAREELEGLDSWSPSGGLEDLEARLNGLYGWERTGTSVRGSDFDRWVELFLPYSADGVLGVPEFGEKLLDVRSSVLTSHNRLESGNRGCAAVLGARIRQHISEEWIASTIALLKTFDSSLAIQLSELHELARKEENADLEAYAKALEMRGVPREIVGQMFLTGISPEVESELHAINLPDATIETLAQRFGRASAPDSSEEEVRGAQRDAPER